MNHPTVTAGADRRFDAIIIGAGQAGPALAGRLTSAGSSVALIERHLFGGTCVNVGCTPTKAMIASAAIAHHVRRGSEYGVHVGPPLVDLHRVRARKDAVVADSRDGLERWLRGMDGCTVFNGHARFESADTLLVNGQRLTGARIFINVGGRAYIPNFPDIVDVPYLTNSSILQLDQVPSHLVIVGGSYIGLEFAQMFRRFGSEVTVVEKTSRVLTHEDEDVSAEIRAILEREGVVVRTDAHCISVHRTESGVVVGVDCQQGSPSVHGSHVLLAVGRIPNTDDLGLEQAGVATDERGYIVVDDELRTTAANVWALGDCNGKGAFTHTAWNDFEIVADNLLKGASRRVSDRILCYGLFIDPPLGRAGMTEREARATGRAVRVGARPMTRVGRAVEKGETQGFMKIIVDDVTNLILGASILGVGGDEAIHGVLDSMSAGAPYMKLRDTVHIHPTVSELVPTMLGELR